ncbi:MAG: sulfotransferase domain-containing protein [Actinomycetota bacterium]|nr:sulfotransferase domain-containing protein [Actinomycetota bacterium]
MRILIAAPPKTGNMWLKCMLGLIYDLKWVKNAELPRPELAAFKEWVDNGGFRDGTIFHQHYRYSDEFCRAVEAVPAHLVTIIRDPYDAFVSSYFTIQQRAADNNLGKSKSSVLAGKPLHHPDVLTYLENGVYRGNLRRADEWLHSGRAVVLRYEDLIHDPMGALTRATDQIAAVTPERIARAIEACTAENMRRRDRGMAKHVRTATVGDSKNHLGEEHFRIFRERYGDLIRRLGYEVR